MQAKPKHQKHQRGSALILVLGILSLVLVMGMAFAFTARTNRQVAKVNADAIRTRLQGESALNAVLALMQSSGVNHPYIGRNFLNVSTSVGSYRFSQSFRLSNGTGYSDDDDAYDEDSRDKIAYDLFIGSSGYVSSLVSGLGLTRPSNHGADPLRFRTITDPDSHTVIGRYVFVVLEDTSKFDINEILTCRNNDANNIPFVRSGDARLAEYNDGAALVSSDFYYNILGNFSPSTPLDYGSYGSTSTIPETVRLGNSIRELRLPGRTFFDPLTAHSGVRNECLRPWMSYQHLSTVTDFATNYAPLYTFYSGEEPEAYYYLNGTTPTECARFDLTGYEWRDISSSSHYYDADHKPTGNGSWDHDGDDAKARTLLQALMADTARHNFWSEDSDTHNPRPSMATRNTADLESVAQVGDSGFGIPWLNGKSEQLVANLIDYCDADHIPTASKSFDFDDLCNLDGPEYFGKEQVPYLNDLMIETRLEYPLVSAAGATPEQYQITFSLVPTVELVNIFPQGLFVGSSNYTCKLRLYGQAVCQLVAGGAEAPLDKFKGQTDSDATYLEFTDSVTISSTAESPANVGYTTKSFTPKELFKLTVPYAGSGPLSTMQFRVDINRVVLALEDNDGKMVDIAVWDNASAVTISDQEDELMQPDDTVLLKLRYSTLQAKDPRANYKHGDYTNLWKWRDDGSKGESNSDSANFWTEGTVNKYFWVEDSAPAGADTETGVTFANNTSSYSTAYIRNSPMESLWELGIIPTGEIGKTINLTDGSADDLLDQVKIGPVKFVRGKYNANTRNPGAVQHLIEGIHSDLPLEHTGSALYVAASGTSNGELQYDEKKPDDTSTWSLTGLPAVSENYNRGQAARELLANVSADTTNTNDLLKEQYIGRTANLLSTRYEMFTIVIATQSLHELTGLSSDNFTAIRNTLTNPTLYNDGLEHGDDSEHICEILGTQVMQVQVLRDAWRNEFRVLQRQIIEE